MISAPKLYIIISWAGIFWLIVINLIPTKTTNNPKEKCGKGYEEKELAMKINSGTSLGEIKLAKVDEKDETI